MSLRPTILLALALQAAGGRQRSELQAILTGDEPGALRIGRLRRLFAHLGAFDKAESLVDKSRARAEALADTVEPDELRQLLNFFVETVLAHEVRSLEADPPVLASLPLAGAAGS